MANSSTDFRFYASPAVFLMLDYITQSTAICCLIKLEQISDNLNKHPALKEIKTRNWAFNSVKLSPYLNTFIRRIFKRIFEFRTNGKIHIDVLRRNGFGEPLGINGFNHLGLHQ